jgi:hypothetical protein
MAPQFGNINVEVAPGRQFNSGHFAPGCDRLATEHRAQLLK